MELAAKIPVQPDAEPILARVTASSDIPPEERPKHVMLLQNGARLAPGFAGVVSFDGRANTIHLPESLRYLAEGDIIRLNPSAGECRVLYRKASHHNVLFVTERCNSRCLMCSQPPRDVDDGWLIDEILTYMPLMSPETEEVCISGGEPTLQFDRLLGVIKAAKEHLPDTSLHMLSNGRLFSYLRYAKHVADISHPDFMIGVPVYSDIPWRHDHIVQANAAFDQTLLGLMNLARVGVKVEIRVVILRQNYQRLPDLARFIVRNLPFTCHVALMGLEPMGFGRSNWQGLWVDPVDCARQLETAVTELDRAGLNVSLYNLQRCVIPESLWPFARKSISDWKNTYLDTCKGCAVMGECAGFFSSAGHLYSAKCRPTRF